MAFTSDARFIRKGDIGTLIFNVGLRDEYHVTKGKSYPMTVVGDDRGLVIEYVNDVGVKATTNYFMAFRDGYEFIRADVPDEVFEDRVNSLRKSHAETIHSKYNHEIDSWMTYCDKVIEAGKKS